MVGRNLPEVLHSNNSVPICVTFLLVVGLCIYESQFRALVVGFGFKDGRERDGSSVSLLALALRHRTGIDLWNNFKFDGGHPHV